MVHIVNNAAIKELFQKDSVMIKIHEQFGRPPNWQRPIGFIALVQIILEQQVHLNAAKAHFNALRKFLGIITVTDLLKMTDLQFRNCQISKQKTAYLRALATAVETGLDFKELLHLEDDEVRKKLLAIKGIGHWTIDMYLMQCHQSKNIIPLGDITIRTTIVELYGIKNKNSNAIHTLVKLWSPYGSLASYFLWHYYLKKRKRTY